ncbi:hypothetical protein FB561_4807 [Kribbella amoyensis]|uniref:Uncharacterized protein n=1 Tax=Kribbella amoyensis TaxID=996641 RepID=A0A561BXR9_9ACTN|nr:hypothetical protein [Kribbella amoyensis]TWD83641.1 hypothetical protein FB561_4807 [Kribbella amoyensis]
MGMTEIFDGRVGLTFGQIYLMSGGLDWPDFDASRRGQVNKLCGAAEAGRLFLATALHTGDVGFRVEVWGEEPPIDEQWEEIVEVSFVPHGLDIRMHGLDSGPLVRFELPEAGYRVRYCGTNLDAGRAADVVGEDEPVVDRYLLQFWPAKRAADVIVKQTSAYAQLEHNPNGRD